MAFVYTVKKYTKQKEDIKNVKSTLPGVLFDTYYIYAHVWEIKKVNTVGAI